MCRITSLAGAGVLGALMVAGATDVASAQQVRYRVDPLPPLAGDGVSLAMGFDTRGGVVGGSRLWTGRNRPVRWDAAGVPHDVRPAGFDSGFLGAPNARGESLGWLGNSTGTTGVVWNGETFRQLNYGPEVRGGSLDDDGAVLMYRPISSNRYEVFIDRDGVAETLAMPAGYSSMVSGRLSNGRALLLATNTTDRWEKIAMRDQAGAYTLLEPPFEHRGTFVSALNRHGAFVAGGYTLNDRTRSFLWTSASATPIELAGIPNATVYANAISDAGLVLGAISPRGADFDAALWNNGVLTTLDALLLPGYEQYDLHAAIDVDASGRILAHAYVDGMTTSVILTPIPTPGALLLAALALPLAARRRRG